MGDEQDASKDRVAGDEVLELLDGISKLVVAKGKKVTEYPLGKQRPDDDELVAAMTGPTGNLRAPTVVVGKTMLIGFNADESGNRIALTDPAGNARDFEYDALGRLEAEVDPAGRRIEWEYGNSGFPEAITDRNGRRRSSAHCSPSVFSAPLRLFPPSPWTRSS